MTGGSAQTIVLIGPTCVGKSTVGALIAERLGRAFVDLDDVAGPYYDEVGMPVADLLDLCDREGALTGYRWWQPARLHSVGRVLADHPGAVIALGAGHSDYEDEVNEHIVAGLLGPCRVVFLLPDADPEVSIDVLRRQNVEQRGNDWVTEGRDYLAEWVANGQNSRLADLTVYRGELSAQQYADAILAALAM